VREREPPRCERVRILSANERLADPARPGVWAAWVVHAKWSPCEDGLLQIWKDVKVGGERAKYGDVAPAP
jgi:hypothetical protein